MRSSQLSGSIAVLGSKSHTLRAILFSALGQGKSIIHRHLASADTQAMIQACRLFGATIDVFSTHLEIQGKITHPEDVIQVGNSGLVLRFCSAIGALLGSPVILTGDYSIRHQRPMKELLSGLSQLGVSAVSMRGDGYAPVIIQGPIKPGKVIISGEDSQPVSALLIAAAFAAGSIELEVRNPGEKPWVALTLDWFDRLGIPYENRNFEYFRLFGAAKYNGFEYTVPGDFSSAAFPIAAALVTGSELVIENVDMKDSQGDKEVISVLRKMGAVIDCNEEKQTLHVKKGASLSGISIDLNNFIDAITILAVVACFAEGETYLYNGAIAKQKECNRIHCIAMELRKMGANIMETEDGLHIKKSTLRGARVFSHHDHRMCMSLAVAALGAEGETRIDSADCVSKTYPCFFQDFKVLGASVEQIFDGK